MALRSWAYADFSYVNPYVLGTPWDTLYIGGVIYTVFYQAFYRVFQIVFYKVYSKICKGYCIKQSIMCSKAYYIVYSKMYYTRFYKVWMGGCPVSLL